MNKRVNPSVAASERRAASAEAMADAAEKSMPKGSATPGALKRLAAKRRAGAEKFKKDRPYLISSE